MKMFEVATKMREKIFRKKKNQNFFICSGN